MHRLIALLMFLGTLLGSALGIALVTTSAASAQAIPPLVLRDGDALYRLRNCDFDNGSQGYVCRDPRFSSTPHWRADFSGTGDHFFDDTLYENGWFVCVAGDSAARSFGAADSVTPNARRDEVVIDWADPVGVPGLGATWTVALRRSGPGAAVAHNCMAFTNTSGAPIELTVYGYFDVDFCGSYRDDGAVGRLGAGHPTQNITDPACPNGFLRVTGVDADADAVAPRPGLTNLLLVGCPDFRGAPFSPGGQFGPGDHTGIMQWMRTLGDGETFVAQMMLAHVANDTSCGTPANSSRYGPQVAGTHGPPRLETVVLPVRSTFGVVAVEDGLPGAPMSLFMGSAELAAPVGPHLTMLNSADLFVGSFGLDAAGRANVWFPIPRVVCGETVYLQAVIMDPGAPPPFGLSQTRGIRWVLGD